MDIKFRFHYLSENTVFLSKNIKTNQSKLWMKCQPNLLGTQNFMNIKKNQNMTSECWLFPLKKKRVLTILDKLQSTIRYQLPWLKIYNIDYYWAYFITLLLCFFCYVYVMCGRNQRGGAPSTRYTNSFDNSTSDSIFLAKSQTHFTKLKGIMSDNIILKLVKFSWKLKPFIFSFLLWKAININ